MRVSRTKYASRNIVFSVMLKGYQILLPFVIRTVMIYFLGVEYVGLNSLFVSILQMLNMAELGVGSAMLFSMYKPIAEDDHVTVCALMKLYKIYYRVIGFVILVAGLILLPFVPNLIKDTVPDGLNIYILYLLNLGATVLSYWLFAYKNSLLKAYQRSDVISKIQMITSSVQYLIQILALIFLKNYYVFLGTTLVLQIITNVATAIVANKMYPNYQPQGNLPKGQVKQINQRVKDLFTSKLGGVIVNAADSIVISAFLGLTALAIYQNYFYVLSAVIGFSAVIYQACMASIGNSVVTENVEKNYEDFKTISALCFGVFGFCTTAFLCLFQPFMTIWVGEDLLLSFGMVVLFCVYFYVYEMMCLLSLYKDAAGIWHQDRFRPLIEALINLTLNIVLVHFIGLYGILLSTIVSMVFVSLPWLYRNLFRYVFNRSSKEYTKLLCKAIAVVVIVATITYLLCAMIPFDGVWGLVVKLLICSLVSTIGFLFLFSRFSEFRSVVALADRAMGGKLIAMSNRVKIIFHKR